MKKLSALIFLVLLSLLMTGCGTKTVYVTQYETITVVVEPSRELYNKVNRIKPPNIDTYTKATVEVKEEILFSYIADINKQVTNLLLDRDAIAKSIEKQKSIVEEQKKKQEEENKKKRDKP